MLADISYQSPLLGCESTYLQNASTARREPIALCIQDPEYTQLVVQNSLCEKLVHSHMPDQSVQYEMKKHSAVMVPLSL